MASERLFPFPRATKTTSTPLSILDSTCARFADTAPIWIFDPPSNGAVDDVFLDRLKSSFISTLNAFPQWAGQLHWAPLRPGGNHTERFNRAMITYGNDADPGVGWGIIRHDITVESFVPDKAELLNGFWAGDAFPQDALLPQNKIALYNLKDYEGLSCMLVQINLFECGGYAVGIRMAHPVADAQSMMVFVHQWAAECRGRLGAANSSSLFNEPIFDPPQLDLHAAGDIDADAADEGILVTARALPLNRFSWWDTDAPGYSSRLVETTKNSIPPADILASTTLSPSTTGPWSTWDLSKPVSFGLLHFTGQELDKLKKLARQESTETSRLDALLSHLFQRITKARSPTQSPEGETSLDVTMDVRRRVSPPLPETFLGSPILLTHIKSPASVIREASIGSLALRLRRTMQQFTPDKVAAHLHDAAFEVSPQRLWLGFQGSLHVLVTSWQRLRLYEVDFEGTGVRPRFVHGAMPKSDGLLVVLDPVVEDGGVDVALHLDGEATGRLLKEFRQSKI
ncbi:transferase family protein [Pseudomassariella vexata]|uniref:Transferase family protein n=1 Tax=Pseudomassariella vexata TaxID=1141098 RepID=A0A1Y2DLE3_9PEZI|nr:transferase family protein [Pseudomassariella vexata]ORY60100.1 transferase family protein [Pseudomassariella vexata]